MAEKTDKGKVVELNHPQKSLARIRAGLAAVERSSQEGRVDPASTIQAACLVEIAQALFAIQGVLEQIWQARRAGARAANEKDP